MDDLFVTILGDILANVVAEQINELIRLILDGGDAALAGSEAFAAIAEGFATSGIDPAQLTNRDWYGVAEAMASIVASRPTAAPLAA